jgi:phage shock protein E
MSGAFTKYSFALFVLSLYASLSAADHTKDSLQTIQENLRSKKAVLLDVRERDEWDDGHLAQAALLPLSKIKSGLKSADLEKFAPKGKIIYLHCAAGGRCVQAAELLQNSGRDLRPLNPGYDDLVEAGFPQAKK